MRIFRDSILIVFLAAVCLVVSAGGAYAGELEFLSKGKYFSVYTSGSTDISKTLNRLNFEQFAHFDSPGGEFDLAGLLAKTLDGLYLRVSDILGIHMYSYHGKVVLLPDQRQVSNMFRIYFGRDFPERSFYVHEKNTIYISAADLTLGMMGHEISHAIISHYFVVPPPAKVQEVLSGYVEYSLRKASGAFPR